MQSMIESLRSNFKMGIINIEQISEDYQKKFILEFKGKKVEELKNILDSE